MHAVIQAQFREFKEQNPSELPENEQFEVFCINAIERGLLGNALAPTDVHLLGDEFGLDGAAILVQGDLCLNKDEAESALSAGKNQQIEFHFYQAKVSEGVDYGLLTKFLDAIIGFFDGNPLAKSDQISDLEAAKDLIYARAMRKNPLLRAFYCYTGPVATDDNTKGLVTRKTADLDKLNLFDQIQIELVSAKSLQDAHRAATNSVTGSFELKQPLTLPTHSDVDQAFLGFVSAPELMKLISTAGHGAAEPALNRNVFFDNVRDFDPDSEINRQIMAELKDGSAPAFVFRNNGITVVTRDIARKNDTFTLEDFQVVNGCQTSNILHACRANIEGAYVPLKLIGSKNADFVASIIVGTNKQNQVKDDQFLALRPIMKDLEEYCKAADGDGLLFFERRENQYANRAVEGTRIFKLSDLVKSSAAMLVGRPNLASDYRVIREMFNSTLFKDSHNVRAYHLAALGAYKFEFLVRNKKIERSLNIYKYYSLFHLMRQHWEGGDFLAAPRKKQEKVVGAILEVVLNNEEFARHVKHTGRLIKKISRAGESRQQLRDEIRTETFLNSFTEAVRADLAKRALKTSGTSRTKK